MVSSTHLPPPDRQHRGSVVGDPHVVLKLRHMFLDRRLVRERPRQHELGLEHRAQGRNHAIKGCRHPFVDRVLDTTLHIADRMPADALIPVPVELFRDMAELDNQIVGQVLWPKLAALFAPQPNQSGFVIAHNHPGIRAADEIAAI
jgi:hypothetical protein